MITWAYKRGRYAARKCVGDHLGIAGNPTGASPEVLASFEQGYRDQKEGR